MAGRITPELEAEVERAAQMLRTLAGLIENFRLAADGFEQADLLERALVMAKTATIANLTAQIERIDRALEHADGVRERLRRH